jgi:hypothetical protein
MLRRFLAGTALGTGLLAGGTAHALPVLGPTGNYYEFVATPLEWSDALAAAASQNHLGYSGHLVTITSNDENQFVEDLVPEGASSIWLAASDLETEGTWKWIAGPEAGQVFWKDGTTITYANWASGEPNEFGLGEDYGELLDASGEWNDIQGVLVQDQRPYVVEYFVPEPGTLVLVGIGFAGLSARRRRSRASMRARRVPREPRPQRARHVVIVLAGCLAAAGSAPVGATPLLLPVLTVDGEAVPVASFDCGEVTVQRAGVTLSAIRCTGSDFTSASGSWTLEAPAVMFHEDFAHVLLGGSFSLRNEADTAQTFDISLSLAVSPGDDSGTSRQGLSGTLSDLDGDGASLESLDFPLFLDGQRVASVPGLFPTSVTAAPSESTWFSGEAYSPSLLRPENSVEIALHFELSAGDVLAIPHFSPTNLPGLRFVLVPEPGSAILLALGMAMLQLRLRSSWRHRP